MIRLTPLIVVVLTLAGMASAQQPPVQPTADPGIPAAPVAAEPPRRPPPPPPVNAPAKSTITFNSGQTLPPQVLDALDQQALGKLYTPQLAPKLPALHQLIETYFAAGGNQRKQALAQIAATGIDPNIVGRLVRIRLYWPQLEPGVYYVNERNGPYAVMYFFGVPKGYDRAKSWPMVIKLPGEGPFFANPPPSADQVAAWYTAWIQQELAQHPDAIIVMPVINLREFWGPTYNGLHNVVEPLLHAFGHLNVDPARVYVYGYDTSGHGAWLAALHYPTCYAGIGSMCAGASADWLRVRLPAMKNIFVAHWHDPKDKLVPVQTSRDLVKKLREQRCPVDYEETEVPDSIPTADLVERIYTKMRQHVRELYPKEVALGSNRPDTIFNRNDWAQVYEMIAPGSTERAKPFRGLITPAGGQEQKLRQLADGGSTDEMNLQENHYTLVATITAPNRIEVTSNNACSMRFYLNDQLVDFSQPITLIVNRQQRFQGIVKPGLEEMFADQTVLGRGWRYFTAHVDFDFNDVDYSSKTRPSRSGKIDYTPIPK